MQFEQRIKQLKRTSKLGAQVSHMLKYNFHYMKIFIDTVISTYTKVNPS